MKLEQILKNIKAEVFNFDSEIQISDISFDSRNVNVNSLFVAIKGTETDGHSFVNSVIEKGVRAVILQDLPLELKKEVCYIKVENTSDVLGVAACNFYDNPSKKLKLVGVTGTNGKTSTATMLYQIVKQQGINCGLISTVEIRIDDIQVTATHTTPDAVRLNFYLNQMLEKGCEYCFMEVSSHSLVQGRVSGLDFCGAIFTNLTHDHLDFHKTFAAYRDAKKMLFDNLSKGAFAIVNADDKNGLFMLQNTKAYKRTYSLTTAADYTCKIIENTFSGLQILINNQELWTKLVGKFNAYNILSVYATLELLGFDSQKILVSLSLIGGVRGRFEHFKSPNGIDFIIDYAHTPDALQNVIDTINYIRSRNEDFFAVFGCGGARDKTKRPQMAKIAATNCDRVILTTDNPRFEKPIDILKDLENGVPPQYSRKVLIIEDRHQAIKTACALAKNGDIVLIAGKGHETYQDINGIKTHFDDMEEVKSFFEQ